MSLLRRAALRHLQRHPLQAGLAVLGVALGVAVVIGVDLARESARRGFLLSTEAVTGRATHQILGGPGGLPDSAYRVVRVDLGVQRSAPLVEGWVRFLDDDGARGRTLRVLGVDPFAEAPFRPYVAPATGVVDVSAILTRPGASLLAWSTADELALVAGDTFAIDVGGVRRTVHVAGTLDPADDLSRRAIADLLLMDIASAQELLDRAGALDRIDLRIDENDDSTIARIEGALPPGARVLETAARTAATAGMTRAFGVNLTALGLVALVFGMFLIYNAMTFSVVQRRPLIGLLRAQGVTRREVLGQVLAEALLIGLAATAVGVALGLLLGSGLVRLVTRTVNDLYYTVTVTGVRPSAWVLAKGIGLGLGATVLATLPPALEATRTSPRAALLRSVAETGARAGVRTAAWLSLPLAAGGAVLLAVSERGLVASFAALFLLILAGAMIAPAGTVLLTQALRPIASRAFGMLGRMATRGVSATLSRTGPAVAALSVAIAVGIAMGLLIGSFRGAVANWLGQALVADVYISTPAATNNRVEATLDPELVRRIRAAPGVAGISTYRNVTLPLDDGDLRLVAVQLFPDHRAAFQLLEGDPDDTWPAFARGGLLVSEPLAYRRELTIGDSLLLPTDRGTRALPVAGIYRDYASEHGIVFVERAVYDDLFDDDAIGSIAVFATLDTEPDALIRDLRAFDTGGGRIVFQSNRALREGSLRVFDRTFAITIVLRALALAVAFVGVLGALMALQLERTREIGILRATGVTPRQLATLITSQTGLLGLAAGILAIPLGLVLAWTMIHVINRRSFGWTIDMQLDVGVLLQSVALALVAALLAGIYPAWRMARMGVGGAVREE